MTSVQFVSILIILNLSFQKVIEVKFVLYSFEEYCMCFRFHHYDKLRQKTAKNLRVTKSNLLEIFCNEDNPIHLQLHENMSLQIVHVLLKYPDKLD